VSQSSGSATLHLYQMQVVDNLLVLHNLDERTTQIYDLKLADYSSSVLAGERNPS
jgi:hypothetical protein